MAVKKEGSKDANQNAMMWWNQFDAWGEIEKQSLQIIESQKEWVNGTREQLDQLEENSKKLTTEWKTNIQNFLIENHKELVTKDFQEWFNKLEGIGQKSQQIAFLPGKTSCDILSKSTEQFEETFVSAVEQNKKVREETTKALEGVIDQMQQAQKELFSFFPFNPVTSK